MFTLHCALLHVRQMVGDCVVSQLAVNGDLTDSLIVDFPEPWKPSNTITVCVTYPDMPFIASIRSGWSHVHYTLNLLLQIHRIDAVCYFRARISAMVAGNVEVGKLVRRLYLYLYFYRKIYYKEVDDRLAVNKLKFTYSHLYNVDFSEPE